jgi:hypothetical protein
MATVPDIPYMPGGVPVLPDITQVPDKDFQAEANRRQRAREAAYEAELRDKYRKERMAQEVKDRAFAAQTGITWDQYEAVEDYVRDKVYEEQR